MRKKILAVVLVLIMVLGTMTGCGIQKFNPNKLTEAQAYVKAAMDDYEIDKTKEFKKASVLLTDDLKADLAGTVDIDKWDVSEIKALVVVGIGAATGENAEDVTYAEGTAPADPDAVTGELLFLMDANKSVMETYTLSSSVTASSDTDAAADPEEMSEVLAELSKSDFKLDGKSIISVKTGIAIKELAIEELIAENSDVSQFIEDTKAAYAKDKSYILSEEYIKTISENSVYDEFATLFFTDMQLKNRLAVLESIQTMSAVEQENALELLDSDELLDSYELQAVKKLVKAKKSVNDYLYENKAKIESYATELNALRDKDPEGYLISEAGAKLGRQETATITYKLKLVDQVVQEIMINAVAEARNTQDVGEREYLIDVAKTKGELYGDLQEKYSIHAGAVVELEKYKAENAAQISSYETELAAAKKAAGSDYKTDIGYMKVELKYEELNDKLKSLEDSVASKKSSLDAEQKDFDDTLAAMADEEKERKQEAAEEVEINALREFCASALDTEVTEYKAKAGQFGAIHKNYAEWQNQNLNYYVPKTSYSSSSKKYSSSSGGSSSGGYDYDKGYGYTAPNPGESLSDYIKRQDPDLYQSMTDRYNSLTD